MRAVPLALIAAIALCASPAAAQPYVQAPCAASAPPAFQDNTQAMWYRRFWTGDCKGLPLRCIGGKPNWNDMVRSLISRATADRREAVTQLACRLGRDIGFEWSRPNAVRRIDTDDLRNFNTLLQKAGDVATGLAVVDAKVKSQTGR